MSKPKSTSIRSRMAEWLAAGTLGVANYPGRRQVWRLARNPRLQGDQRFTVDREDGTALDCWYSPAATDSNAPTSAGPRPLPLVMLHGWFEVKEHYITNARRFNALGRDVILFDHRAHGRSTGRRATFGLEEKSDLQAVIDYAFANGLFTGTQVVTLGFSMGAATVIEHAAIDHRVAGTAALAPFVNFRQAVESYRRNLAPWMGREWLANGFERHMRRVGLEFDSASPLVAVEKLDRPLLLIQGGRDRALPPKVHCEPLADGKQTGRLERLTVHKARHGTLTRKSWPELNAAVDAFFSSLDVVTSPPTATA